MDPSRRLFRGLWRIWRRLGPQPAPPQPHAAELNALQGRLSILASCLLGEIVEVKPGSGLGGMFGRVLLLPERIEVFGDRDRNEQAYLLRVMMHVRCAELGIVVAEEPSSPGAALTLLLAARAVIESLERDYPGARELRLRLAPELCAHRPAPHASSPAGLLEGFSQLVLSGADPFRASLPGSVSAWWTRAIDPRTLPEHSRELYDALVEALPGPAGPPPEPVVLWGRLVAPAAAAELAEAARAELEPRAESARVITLRRAIQLRRRSAPRREDRPLYHAFEKLETAEDYAGETGTPDPEQDVASMQDAIEELSLATAIRTQERPRDLVRVDVLLEPGGLEAGAEPAEPASQVFHYPEWDHRHKRLREHYCTVIQERLPADGGDRAASGRAREIARKHKRHIDEIRMHLVRSLYRRTVRNRQLDGPEIDVEAMVERHADLHAKQSPPERLFLAARKSPREFAVALLLDTSFSSDAWIEGKRVLDVEIESLIVLAAALEGYVEQEVLVATFHSQTRNSVRFGVIKDFDQSWQSVHALAPSLAPQGYTRIGAAVRHATALLRATEARHKLLLLVSDGKPTDFDRYEGNYGIEDIAHAVREAAGSSIQTFGLAIEQKAKLHLARMLGAGRYRILPSTEHLPDVMAEVFVSMLTG